MEEIYLLTDYKGHFGSKYNSEPYRSGMRKELLNKYFLSFGYKCQFVNFHTIDFKYSDFKDKIILYTSQEDVGYHYKDFIEDIIYGLELGGAKVLPPYKFLRANNNKVFMEILRDQLQSDIFKTIESNYFGCLEEIEELVDNIEFPVVLKSAEGAMSSGVSLAKNKKELLEQAKKISRTKYLKKELWEKGRAYKHKGYITESKYRKKFIIQNYIPDLQNDWKVYVFGDRYYIFYRPIFKHREFKASGGGYPNYYYGNNASIPEGIFDFAQIFFNELNIPNVSIDVAYDNKQFHLLEFQAVYFGTAGIMKKYSKEYFIKENNSWKDVENEGDIEKVYVESIVNYLSKKKA